jgi:iron complex transport system permease protein
VAVDSVESLTTTQAASAGRHVGRFAWKSVAVLLFVLVPFLCIFGSLFLGRYHMTFSQVVGALFPFARIAVPKQVSTLVVQVRLPRALAAACVGASLSASGVAFQGVFRSPLVNPELLGVSSGSGFGAAFAIVVFGGGFAIYPLAFAAGTCAVLMSYWVARVYKKTPAIMLILGGVIVSSVFSALVGLMKYVADPETQLPSIVYWLMGSLSAVSFKQFWALIPMGLGVAVLLATSWRIDILSMGDKEARSLGVNANAHRGVIVLGATLATAGAVCISGVVGWVGLVIPHIGRMLVGSNNRRLMPASISIGASFLVLVDTMARGLWASEVPLGILTALIGAPFFVYLLKKTKGGDWR